MSRHLFTCLIGSGWIVLLAAAAVATAVPAGEQEPVLEDRSGPVHLLTIDGPITDGLPRYVTRGVRRAEQEGSACLVVRIRSFGGLLAAATVVKDELMATDLPTVAFVDRRAISAGALIALACDRITMVPGGSIGAATPFAKEKTGEIRVDEKMVSAVRAIFRSTAEANGHPVEIAEAMVDSDVAIEGVVEAGKLLTLSSSEAMEAGLAREVADLEALLAAAGLGDREQVEITLSPAEHLANGLTSPAIAGLLLSIGMLALIAAFKVPGTGLPEAAAVLAFGGFLFGKHVAGLAGVEDTALIVAGLALLGLEIFVIPGTTVAGVAGVLALMAGVVLSFVGEPTSSPFFLREIKRGVSALGMSLLVAAGAGTGLFLLLRRTRAWKRFTLQRDPGDGSPATAVVPVEGLDQSLVGSTGTTLTALRPEGEVEIEGRRLPARAERGFLANDVEVVVVDVGESRVVVDAARPEPDGQAKTS